MHAARRTLVIALEKVQERNQLVGVDLRDWVSVITFDRVATIRQTLGGDDTDYVNAINTAVELQATHDEGASTAMEDGMIDAKNQLTGSPRTTAKKVVIVLTDGTPNKFETNRFTMYYYIQGLLGNPGVTISSMVLTTLEMPH